MKKVLVIDDDTRNIFALCAVLRAKGYACISATNAVEGLEILEHDSQVGIVLMDMMMPEMDGYEAIPKIRENAHFSSIPIIAVTAQAMTGDREKCLEAGATGYVSKPVDIDLLKDLLDKHLS